MKPTMNRSFSIQLRSAGATAALMIGVATTALAAGPGVLIEGGSVAIKVEDMRDDSLRMPP